MKPSSLRIHLALASLVLFSSILTACTLSVAGGLGGVGISLALLLIVLAGTTTTQTGCDLADPCLSIHYPDHTDAEDDTSDADDQDAEDTALGAFHPTTKPAHPTHLTSERTRLLAKFDDRLPSDVLAKIDTKTDPNVDKKA